MAFRHCHKSPKSRILLPGRRAPRMKFRFVGGSLLIRSDILFSNIFLAVRWMVLVYGTQLETGVGEQECFMQIFGKTSGATICKWLYSGANFREPSGGCSDLGGGGCLQKRMHLAWRSLRYRNTSHGKQFLSNSIALRLVQRYWISAPFQNKPEARKQLLFSPKPLLKRYRMESAIYHLIWIHHTVCWKLWIRICLLGHHHRQRRLLLFLLGLLGWRMRGK